MEKGSGYDDMISCTKAVSVSISYSRCSNLAISLCFMTWFPYEQHIDFLLLVHIYGINIILYPYALPLESYPLISFQVFA